MLTCRNKFLTYQEKNVWLYEWIASRMKHDVIYIMIYMFSIYRFIAFVHCNIQNLYNWWYLIIPPETKFMGGYTGFTLFVRPSVCLSVRPSVRPWVGVRMITLILFSGFKNFFYIYHLGQDLAWDWISASYLIKYAHTGRSCDLLIFGIPEVNFLVRAFQFGMKGVLSRIYDISPLFCWIPIFVFFLNFLRVS